MASTAANDTNKRPKPRRWLSWVWLFVGLAWVSFACGPPEPLPQDASPPDVGRCFEASEGSPLVQAFDFESAAPGQTRVLLFKLDWSDAQKDLIDGSYQFLIDGVPQQKWNLTYDEALSLEKGTLRLPLVLPEDYSVKGTISVEIQLWDRRGNGSNKALVVLEAQQ